MRALIIVSLLGLAACSKGYQASNQPKPPPADAFSVRLGNGYDPTFSRAQMQSVSNATNAIVSDAVLQLQGLNGVNFNFGPTPSVTLSNQACANGGTYSVTAGGTL